MMIKIKHVAKGTLEPAQPFTSLEEEANYWDTHSVVDEIDEKSGVGYFTMQKADSLTIRFTASDIKKLRSEAEQKGIGPSTLARMWILERLRGERHSST